MTPSEPITLLIVDDSSLEHKMICGLLKPMEGLRIVVAGDGVKALEALERESPDLILTDLVMPDMDGLELVQRVRSRFPAIPIILMTAHGSEEAAMRALRAGAANYIPKRDLGRDLVETIQGILRITDVDRQRRRLLRCLEHRETVFRLGNDANLIVSLMDLVQEELDGMGVLDRMSRIRVSVALQEALTNSMYHGNLELSSDLRQDDERCFYREAEARRRQEPYASRHIEVGIKLDRREATFSIVDEGPGFDTSRLDCEVSAENLMRVGGRGLLLIRTFMDLVSYSRGGRCITMVKRYG